MNIAVARVVSLVWADDPAIEGEDEVLDGVHRQALDEGEDEPLGDDVEDDVEEIPMRECAGCWESVWESVGIGVEPTI